MKEEKEEKVSRTDFLAADSPGGLQVGADRVK
jgi:hypothetical protein